MPHFYPEVFNTHPVLDTISLAPLVKGGLSPEKGDVGNHFSDYGTKLLLFLVPSGISLTSPLPHHLLESHLFPPKAIRTFCPTWQGT